jgi:hypothetical protein
MTPKKTDDRLLTSDSDLSRLLASFGGSFSVAAEPRWVIRDQFNNSSNRRFFRKRNAESRGRPDSEGEKQKANI